jgi:protein-S-isoprenylcysteine O-methyltransferase Ste14
MTKFKSILFVAVQFSCIFYIFLSGNLFAKNIFLLMIEVSGILLGTWAVLSMNAQTLNVFPTARDNASLSKTGPYKLIRHPMYVSVFLVLLPLVIDAFSFSRLGALLVLVVNLLLKIHFEEQLLLSRYPGYKKYMHKSKKLIPYIY